MNDDSDYANQSVQMSTYKRQIAEYYQTLIESFRQIDQNQDDFIDQNELVTFLDSKMPPGKVFDRNLLQKMFEILDKDRDGKISTEEFFRTYVEKQEELKIHIEGIKSVLEKEKQNMQRYEKLKFENTKEYFVSDGVSNNAKLKVDIVSVHLLDQSSLPRGVKQISLRIKLDPSIQATSNRSVNNLVFNESFEFPVLSADGQLQIEICSGDKSILGDAKIPLKSITNQEENEIELEVLDPNNDRTILFNINTKITLVLSFYKLYQDKYIQAEREYNNNLSIINKLNLALENLSEPFKFLQNLEGKSTNVNAKTGTTSQGIEKTPNATGFKSTNRNDFEFKVADQVENILKNAFNTGDVQWLRIINILTLTSLLFSFINLFLKADFISTIICIYILVIYYTTLQANLTENLNSFFKFSLALPVYDLLWLFFNSSVCNNANERSLKSFIYIISLIGFVVKLSLIASIWIQRKKAEKNSN